MTTAPRSGPIRPEGDGPGVLLDITSQSHHVVFAATVVNPDYVLFDDGPFIEILGHIVAGCTDQFHTTVISFLVGVRANEGWQETVVDVYAAPGKIGTQVI